MEQSIRIPPREKRTNPVFVIVDDDAVVHCSVADHAEACVVLLEIAPVDRTISITHINTLGAHATLRTVVCTIGGAGVHHELCSRVGGERSENSVDWIFYGKGREVQKMNARNIFEAPHGRGEITVHGVAEDHAHCTFNGMIDIGKKGNGTDTYLTETVMMLDETAKVDAVPGLEIKTNDVKASHSATVTKVSPDDLFYLASRGITDQEARRLYIEGFLGALVERIPDATIRRRVLEEISRKYERNE